MILTFGLVEVGGMAKLLYGLKQSLDGHVDHQKFVPSPRCLKPVRLHATLGEEDIEAVVRGLKAELTGEIEVAGPTWLGA